MTTPRPKIPLPSPSERALAERTLRTLLLQLTGPTRLDPEGGPRHHAVTIPWPLLDPDEGGLPSSEPVIRASAREARALIAAVRRLLRALQPPPPPHPR